MYYLIYKVTNLLNGKFYIGKHKTQKIDDGYMGSGTLIRQAIAKYGKNNFQKEILQICETEEIMNLMEIEIIDPFPNNPLSYNLCRGGKGGFDYINSSGLNKGSRNVMVRDIDAKNKCITNAKITRAKNKEHYDAIGTKNLSKTWERNKGKKRPDHSEFMSEFNNKLWSNSSHVEHMKDVMSATWEITSPIGVKTITTRLKEFCTEHDLGYVVMTTIAKTGKIRKQGKHKGWNCQKLAP